MSWNTVRLVRDLPREVRLLLVGTFVNRFGTFIVPYLSIVLRRDFGLSAGVIGRLMLAYGIGSCLSILLGGWLTDRLGRRVTLAGSLLVSGTVATLLAAASSLTVFAALLMVYGFVADLYRPALSSSIADLLPSRDRVVGLAALRVAINLGVAFGMVLGGLLAEWSWRALFIGDGLTTILFGALVAARHPETAPRGPDGAVAGTAAEGPGPLRDRVLWELLAATLALVFIFFNFISTLPLTITNRYPAWVSGAALGLNGLLCGVLEVPVAAALRRFRRLRTAAVGTLFTGVGFALTGVFDHWAWYVLTVVLWTAGELLSMPQMFAFVTDWAPVGMRGRYLGIYTATWSVALALNPPLFLPLQARLGDAAFWPLMLLLAVPAAALLLRLDRNDRPELLRGRTPDGG
jgi:MFS family permease